MPISTMTSAGRRGYFIVRAGETYEWSTRQADSASVGYESELTLFQAPSTTPACYGNDPGGPEAFITWTSPTDGAVYVGLNEVPCTGNASASVVTWRCASCPELPEVLVPDSGSNEVACGTNVRLLDPGGNGYYPNDANGYTVLHASGTAVIQLRGTSAIENWFDKLAVFAGSAPVGTPLVTYDASGYIDYTGAPGQTLTARFRSDGSSFMAGFDLQVTYTDLCAVVGIHERGAAQLNIYPNPSSGSFTLLCSSDMQVLQLDLVDVHGSTIRTFHPRHVIGTPLRVELENSVASGCYFLRVHTPTGVRVTRVVIQ